jgi:ubiquinone/menaquinone biosynthesis C-methylase UbiE
MERQTIDTYAKYLVPYVKPTMKILEVGCGTGSAVYDLAKLVPEGCVIGLDRSEDSITKARERLVSPGTALNVSFVVGDVLSLQYPDDEFDIVHSHQLFHHVDATVALQEMRRVTKRGGIIACRDGSHILRWPIIEELEEFTKMSERMAKGLGGNTNTGAKYRRFSRAAGFKEEDIQITATTRCYASKSTLEPYCCK